MNGEARKHALAVMSNTKATLKEKIDAMLFLQLQDHDRMVEMHEAHMTNPFSMIPAAHRGKVWAFFFAWFIALSIAFGDQVWTWAVRLGLVAG